MYAMQYRIALPADYDMKIIRERVLARGSLTDHFAGLGLKAYLIQERAQGGGQSNQYAPFYLWSSSKGMANFLWGSGGFAAVVDSFGRPRVRHWTGLGFMRGRSHHVRPRTAILRERCISQQEDLRTIAQATHAELNERAGRDGVYACAAAIDPTTWNLINFTLCDREFDESGERYEVLHLSTPHLHEL